MKRSLLAIFLAAFFVISGASTTQALHDTQSTTILAAREQEPKLPAQDNTTDDKRVEMEARKEELEQKLEEKRAAITTKLMGARAEKCEKKQVNINSMLDKRVESAQKHFDTFKAIQTRLTTLVEEKDIIVDNDGTLKFIMTSLEGKTQGSITTLGKLDFSCGSADALAPGAIVKDQVSIAKQDLKDYRDAIKDYAQAIKASVEKPAETAPEDEPATEEAPVEETPSTEQSIEGVQQ